MAKPERALNLALSQLRRADLPPEPPDFGVEEALAGPPRLRCDEAVRRGLASAARMTCDLTAARVDALLAMPPPRHVIIHLIDLTPATPLLAYWSMRHAAALARVAARLADDLAARVAFVLPSELHDRLRGRLRPLRPVIWVDPRYPGGHWRLLPRAARLPPARTLTLDAIAATDIDEATITGKPAARRPIVVSEGNAAIYRTLDRGAPIASLLPGEDDVDWYVGPRLADRVAAPDACAGDGELTFYREARADRAQAACVRCGACLDVCPTRVDPVALLRARDAATIPSARRLRRAGLDACVDCGLCTASCPTGIELHHAIADLRAQAKAAGGEATAAGATR